ncbi:fimbrillin family protein [Bacteroides ihuae]|uniref:fimbrillin family protein n=1 Tax=Bacteroides ihuae TaxID=1852362 RepID=UPI0008DAEB7A|nr:fimbrillin family protein [Bacteroides ihuae]
MNKFNKLAIFAAITLSAVACSQNDEPMAQTDHFPADGVIRVAADVNKPQTRAGMTTDNLSDFFMYVENPLETTGKYTYFVKIKKDGGVWKSYNPQGDSEIAQGLTASEKVMLWQNKMNPVNVTAFRIPNNVVASTWAQEHKISIEKDQTQQENMEKSDILYMLKKSINPATDLTVEGKMKVQLDHFFAKLNLTLKLGTEFNLQPGGTTSNIIEEVRVCGTSTDVMWELDKPVMTNNFTKPDDIRPFAANYTAGEADTKMAEAKYECIFIPQSVPNTYANAGTPMVLPPNFLINIKIGGKTYAWESKNTLQFTHNTQYNLTLNVGKDAITLGGFSILPWGDGGSADIETE